MSDLETFRPRGCDAWPASAKGLGDALRRLSTSMRMIGIEITEGRRTKRGYPVRIARIASPAVVQSPAAVTEVEEF